MLRDQLRLHVLALDWSEVQTQGAARKDGMKKNRGPRLRNQGSDRPPAGTPLSNGQCDPSTQEGSLTYVTTKINTDSLLASTQAWVTDHRSSLPPERTQPTPVLFAALHACGSLTPDILRAVVSASKADPHTTCWEPRGAVVVGCCYNLLRPEG